MAEPTRGRPVTPGERRPSCLGRRVVVAIAVATAGFRCSQGPVHDDTADDAGSVADSSRATGVDAEARDRETPDAGVSEAGPRPDAADAGDPVSACDLPSAEPGSLALGVAGACESHGQFRASVEGPATVDFAEPLVLLFDDGEVARVYLASELALPPGFRVWAEIVIYQPWWTEHRIVLRELNGTTPGRLLGASWHVSLPMGVPQTEPELSLTYRTDNCGAVDVPWSPCGPQISETLVVATRGTSGPVTATVATGARRPVGDYEVINFEAFTYEGRPRCTDTPQGWARGAVLASNAPWTSGGAGAPPHDAGVSDAGPIAADGGPQDAGAAGNQPEFVQVSA